MSCIACGSLETRSLYEVRGFSIVRCAACGLGRTVLPPGVDPDSLYTEAYFTGGDPDGYADYAGSADDLRREFRRTLNVLPVRSGRLVELGCAYGFFLDEASTRFEVRGVEVSEIARAACRARGHVVARDLAGVADRAPFDAAVMLDVLEHLERPDEVLAELAALLRPGASLLLTTGDFDSRFARVTGRHWRLMTPPLHIWFFSPSTLTALLTRHGFRVQSITHPWKWVPLELAKYQLARHLGLQRFVRRVALPGRFPVNLFDAIRVVATRS